MPFIPLILHKNTPELYRLDGRAKLWRFILDSLSMQDLQKLVSVDKKLGTFVLQYSRKTTSVFPSSVPSYPEVQMKLTNTLIFNGSEVDFEWCQEALKHFCNVKNLKITSTEPLEKGTVKAFLESIVHCPVVEKVFVSRAQVKRQTKLAFLKRRLLQKQ